MAVEGSCHCGTVRIAVPGPPDWLASCNCSLCTKLGWLVAYYPDDGSVTVTGETVPYIWGDRMIAIHHCPTCGSGTHWQSTGESYGCILLRRHQVRFVLRDGRPFGLA